MSSYGWTLDEALDLTYPQVKMLYRTLMKWPTANMFVAAMAKQMTEGSGDAGKIEKIKAGAVSVVDGAEFMKRFGIKPDAEGV